MSSTLESYVNHTVSVITADGRQIVGTLKGFDQTVNVILDDSHERVYSATHGVEQVPLGLYIVRGDNIDDLVNLYREFAKIPLPLSGQLFSGQNERQKSLKIVWKVRDMDRLEATRFATNYSIKLTKDSKRVKHIFNIGEQIDVTNDLAIASRAQGSQYMAVVRKGSKDPESGKVKQYLEIWNKITKIKSIDIESLEEHSSLVLDSQFGNFLWSPNGKRLLYVAEYKSPKAQSYYKKAAKSENCSIEGDTRGQEFVHRDDWGEGFDGIVHTVIAILDVENDFKIRTIEMNGYSLGQPFWIGSGESVGFVGWAENPRRLGIIYCTNRLSSIFSIDLTSEECQPKLIYGSENTTVRDPRPTPDGTGFVYLQNESGGPHHSASRLMFYNFKSQSNEVIVDVNGVRELIPDGNGSKYGKVCSLFTDGLSENCFTSDGKHIIVNCFTELQFVLYLVDLKTKDLKPIAFPLQSVRLMDIKDDVLVVVGSSSNVVPNVFIGKLTEDNTESIEWFEIKTNSSDTSSEISSENYSIPSGDPKKLLTCVLTGPKSVETVMAPTIILPHGGPHSLLLNSYMSYPLMLAKLGLKTLLVNYRGSTGVDKDYVDVLPGNAGQMDVKDVVDCIQYFIDKGLVDASKLILWGGSHGGFLVTHLSGQYHHMNFKACIARNPVVDISSKLDGTDIPDWSYVETFGKSKTFGFDTVLDPDSLKVMFEKSPINWITNVKVPTLMMLGKRDRRVPMTQGLKYYRILKARGVKTQCHIYDDKHDLQKVDVDGDAFVNICLWILDNLRINRNFN